MPFAPFLRTVLRLKIKKKIIKMLIFCGAFYDPGDPISTNMNDKRMQNSKSAHQINPGGTKTRKMTYDVIKGH